MKDMKKNKSKEFRVYKEGQSNKDIRYIKNILNTFLMSHEHITYIAIQKLNFVLKSNFIVLTNKRIIFCTVKYFGKILNFQDIKLLDIKDSHIEEKMFGGKFIITDTDNKVYSMNYLPKKQCRKLYSHCQRIEDLMFEERRERKMEENKKVILKE